MLLFVVPVKSKSSATSWPDLSKLFNRCLNSICKQTSPDFHVIVVCNERPDNSFSHSKVTYLDVDFPTPKPEYNARVDDRAKRVVTGILAAQKLCPTHIMSVDADDCVSKHIAEFVSANVTSNGWYVNSGYEYQEGSQKILIRRNNFNKICGTCNIINYDLLQLPEKLLPYEELSGYDRFIGGHPLAKIDLAERGSPLAPLPFPGAIFVRDPVGESVSMQEDLLAKLRRNPRELLRNLKKPLITPFNEKIVTDEIRETFGLYPLY